MWRSERVLDGLRALAALVASLPLAVLVPDIGVALTPATPAPSLPMATALLVVSAVGTALRRTHPVVGLLLATAAITASVLTGTVIPLGVVLIAGDLLYAAALFGSHRTSTALLAVLGAGGVVLIVIAAVADGGRAAVASSLNLLLPIAPVLWGREVRWHQERTELEHERADRIRQSADRDRDAAVAAERARMARDLHDVIAGQLSGIAIASEAALTLRDLDADALRRVLGTVRRDSVASLVEMRTMIGLLRADGSAADEPRTAPAGLSGLHDLLQARRLAGQRITLDDRRGAGHDLPGAVGLTAHRIVQEALTNAAKHAPGAEVEVQLSRSAGRRSCLTVRVSNALVPAAAPGGGTGFGLIGLRERADALGGDLVAGPADDRFVVRAVLPLPDHGDQRDHSDKGDDGDPDRPDDRRTT